MSQSPTPRPPGSRGTPVEERIPEEERPVTFHDRLVVASVASDLIDSGDRARGDRLVNAVRCCGEFPECSHVLAYIEREDHEAPR